MLNNAPPAKRITFLAMLIALALALSAMERLLPVDLLIPVPGIKIGLPNLVTLFAIFYLDFASSFLIVILRCLLSALLFGGVTAFIFSLCGGLFALLAMYAVKKAWNTVVSPLGISMAGAAFHNLGQIVAASWAMKTSLVFTYLPLLLLSSIGTGLFTGFLFVVVNSKLNPINHIDG